MLGGTKKALSVPRRDMAAASCFGEGPGCEPAENAIGAPPR
jgi:hypothetical protein